jgi:hypothetical protein
MFAVIINIFRLKNSVVEPEPELFAFAEPEFHSGSGWIWIWIQNKTEYKSLTKSKYQNEMTTFWDTMLLLALKRQDFVEKIFSAPNVIWIRLRICIRDLNFSKVGRGTISDDTRYYWYQYKKIILEIGLT